MPLGFTIGQPPSNGVVIIGEKTLVSGIAIQGPAAPSPCSSTARRHRDRPDRRRPATTIAFRPQRSAATSRRLLIAQPIWQ